MQQTPQTELKSLPVVHRVQTPKYGGDRVTPDYQRTFSAFSKPINTTMYLEPGRTVQLNLNRMPTPHNNRDFRSTILLGGHTSFREMSISRQSDERTRQQSAKPPSDMELMEQKREEQRRFALEFDIAVRREQLMQKQREEQEAMRRKTDTPPVRGGSSGSTLILDTVDRPQVVQKRALTPAQQTRRTMKAFAERAKTPDLSFEALYKEPTKFELSDSSKPADYDAPFEQRPATRCSSSMSTRQQPRLIHSRASSLRGECAQASSSQVDDPYDLNTPTSLLHEVNDFERKRAEAEEEENEYPPEIRAMIQIAHIPPPPKLILMLFRFGNVRNLTLTEKLRRVGYAVLHEQFSSNSERGCITRNHFLSVAKRYAEPSEMQDALKILNCFDKSAMGDVEINQFLLGMQILLQCASAADTLKYSFSLMDTNNRVPRYITRFEIQSLLESAMSVRREKIAERERSGVSAQLAEEEGDKEFDVMAHAIHEMMVESWRYDYMGRISLKVFITLLQEKVAKWKEELWSHLPRAKRPTLLLESMGMGNGWQSQPAVAAAHRMSSKKMLYQSLQYHEIDSLKDPHRILPPNTTLTGKEKSRTTSVLIK